MRIGRSYTYFRGAPNDPNRNPCVRWLLTILVAVALVAAPALLLDSEYVRREMTAAFHEVRDQVQPTYGDANVDRVLTGQLVYLTSKDIRSGAPVVDEDFRIEAPQALRLRRHVEYCQWQEHVSEVPFSGMAVAARVRARVWRGAAAHGWLDGDRRARRTRAVTRR